MCMKSISANGSELLLFKSPSADDSVYFQNELGFHPLIIRELGHQTLHPKIEVLDDRVMVVLQFPHFDRGDNRVIASEIDFILEEKRLTVVQYDNLEPFDKLLAQFDGNDDLKLEFFEKDAAFLLYKILDYLLKGLFPQLDHITEKINRLEEEIFDTAVNENIVQRITLLRRESADFRRTIRPNVDIVAELARIVSAKFNHDSGVYYHDLVSIQNKISRFAENQVETLGILHETNESLLSDRTNKIIRTLTIFSVIIFPLTLFAAIWGMDFKHIPLIDHPYGFWIALSIMAIGTLAMLLAFKLKKWL
jgi:magnesium transporter